MQKLKLWYGVSQRYAAGQDFDRLPFTKVISRRSKLPLKLKPFKKFLEGSVNERRVALTVLSIYRIISSTNEAIDYSQIEAPRTIPRNFEDLDVNSDNSYLSRVVQNNPTSINKKLLASWRHCVNTMFPSSGLSYRKSRLTGNNLYVSNKNGPNGPALSGVLLDFIAMSRNGLINDVFSIAELTSNEYLTYIIADFYQTAFQVHTENAYEVIASRLSLKQEPGGKNRVFAIGDYFTQCSLMSLHKYLFGYIKGLPEDGTHSHNYVSQIAKNWSDCQDNRIYSVDLTGATNFIDCEVLGEIVQSIAGEEYAKHWVNLMVGRDFTDIEGEPRRYTVGQPMGFYSSWAMLAVWNHLMLRTCRHALGLHPSQDDPQFVIIGDDVAILGDDVAHMYLHLCKLMGVPVSPLKGFSPNTKALVPNPLRHGSTMNSVEIAKRIFVDGLEITPISPVEITAGLSESKNFPSLLLSMEERGINTTDNEELVKSLARLTPSYTTSLDVSLFPMAPALNWVEMSESAMISIPRCSESFWCGKPYFLVSQLFYVYINQRINRSYDTLRKVLTPFFATNAETIVTCRKYQFSSLAYGRFLQLIGNVALAMSQDIVQRFKIGYSQDETTESVVANARNVRRQVGMITTIFELESLAEISNSFRFIDKKDRVDRIITEVTKDIKAMFT